MLLGLRTKSFMYFFQRNRQTVKKGVWYKKKDAILCIIPLHWRVNIFLSIDNKKNFAIAVKPSLSCLDLVVEGYQSNKESLWLLADWVTKALSSQLCRCCGFEMTRKPQVKAWTGYSEWGKSLLGLIILSGSMFKKDVLKTEDETLKPMFLCWDVLQLLQSLHGQEKQSCGKQRSTRKILLIRDILWKVLS